MVGSCRVRLRETQNGGAWRLPGMVRTGRARHGRPDKVRNSSIVCAGGCPYLDNITMPLGGHIMQFALFSAIWFAASLLAILVIV